MPQVSMVRDLRLAPNIRHEKLVQLEHLQQRMADVPKQLIALDARERRHAARHEWLLSQFVGARPKWFVASRRLRMFRVVYIPLLSRQPRFSRFANGMKRLVASSAEKQVSIAENGERRHQQLLSDMRAMVHEIAQLENELNVKPL